MIYGGTIPAGHSHGKTWISSAPSRAMVKFITGNVEEVRQTSDAARLPAPERAVEIAANVWLPQSKRQHVSAGTALPRETEDPQKL